MSTALLVITASHGENLKLAERIAAHGPARGLAAEVLDLTTLPLPLYTSRLHAEQGIPEAAGALAARLATVPRWVICAPEYNGSIPPLLTSTIAWLSVQGDDFRSLFNGRPIGMASHSGGGGMALLTSLRIQLAHLGANVVGRHVLGTAARPASDDSIDDLLRRLALLEPFAAQG